MGGGLFLGLLFGVVVQRTQFCMVTAVSNVVLMRDFRHAHAYFAALLVAILGTLFLETGGLAAISETGYRVPRYDWLVIIGGGLLFGFVAVCWLEVVPGERRYGRQRGIWEHGLFCLPLH